MIVPFAFFVVGRCFSGPLFEFVAGMQLYIILYNALYCSMMICVGTQRSLAQPEG